jgi:hypothetical protein
MAPGPVKRGGPALVRNPFTRRRLRHLEEQWYPLGEELLAPFPEVEQLAAEGSVRIAQRGSRWCRARRIFVAYRR